MGLPAIQQVVSRVTAATDWNARVEEIRHIREAFGDRDRPRVYSAVAAEVYKPHLSAQFASVLWREEYELEPFNAAYQAANKMTNGFRRVTSDALTEVLLQEPQTLRIFRAIIGYTPGEFAVAAAEAGKALNVPSVSQAQVRAMEEGRPSSEEVAKACAEAIYQLIAGTMWGVAMKGGFRSKLEKPDTRKGWDTVREMADKGVPYHVLLHQRYYGGAFRTLLDATSTRRGDVLLEEPVENLLSGAKIPFVKTGAANQQEITSRFNITVRPAPDFVVFEPPRTLRAMIECKQANDGGTARDKAGRFAELRAEGQRLGGIPLFAVVDGLGWERTGDALGPVVRDTDGRVFTLATLESVLAVQPLPGLRGLTTSSPGPS